MKIDLFCRTRYPALYERMSKTVFDTSKGVSIFRERDDVGEPKLVETYNRLIPKSDCDIVGIVQDDVEFLDTGWDTKVKELFVEYKPDILGVIGCTQYKGGGVFDAGSKFGWGLIADSKGVRILSPRVRYGYMKVVDGCLMFINRKFLENNPFDPAFDGLFYWDIDLCLRAKQVGVSDILVRHSKTADLYGKYPANMKPRSHYEDYFEKKHGMRQGKQEEQMCCLATMDDFKKFGQNKCYRGFQEKYLCV